MSAEVDQHVVALLVPVVAIVFGVAVAIVAIVTSHRQKLQRLELRHRERLAAIEKGLELLPDPPDVAAPAEQRPRFLLRGLVLLFTGAAVTAAMLQMRTWDAEVPYLLGLIPSAVGLGYLAYYFIEARHEAPRLTDPDGRSS